MTQNESKWKIISSLIKKL